MTEPLTRFVHSLIDILKLQKRYNSIVEANMHFLPSEVQAQLNTISSISKEKIDELDRVKDAIFR